MINIIKMKKKYILPLMLIVTMSIISACKQSFLDKPTEPLTEAKVFADSTLTFSFLNDIYAYTGQDVVPQRSNFITSASVNGANSNDYACMDDLTSSSISFYSDPQLSFMTGTSSATGGPFINYWATYYKKIRAATLLMQYLPTTPLSTAKRVRLMGEARYLRAFYYAALVRLFGGVQLMGDQVLGTTDVLVSKRNTYKECVDYITSELDAAAPNLPTVSTQQATDYGRATQGACLALKARVLITAASPLFNGHPISTSGPAASLIAYSATYDASLWQKAADACKAVIDLGQYSLVVDNVTRPGHGFWKMFVKARYNSEYIVPYMITAGTILEQDRFPTTRGGQGWSTPSENMVEAFGMKSGKSINDPSSNYNASNPYVNRDPRFYFSIIYNQAPIYKSGSGSTLVPVDIYFNLATNQLTADALQNSHTKTGFYSRKMCNDSTGTSANVNRSYPVLRYAEILMDYAEALNELGNTGQAITYVEMIRARAGIDAGSDGTYGIGAGINQADLRTLIHNEDRVEFFDEGHWFYDTRRWKTAEVTENQTILGMYVTRQLNGTFTYASIATPVLSNFQNPKMYIMPVPQSEINKSATLIQNPGW
jgi:hypothetical protein